jgi:hypothetical protein
MNITIKDLTKEAPRSPRERIHNYVIIARMIDKARAHQNGQLGEYLYNNKLDNTLFKFKGITADQINELIKADKTDEEIAAWIDQNGKPKSPEEVKQWSDTVESFLPGKDPIIKEWFTNNCKKAGLCPDKTTMFDYLENDDKTSFEENK